MHFFLLLFLACVAILIGVRATAALVLGLIVLIVVLFIRAGIVENQSYNRPAEVLDLDASPAPVSKQND